MTASGLPSEGGELNSPKVLEELLVLPPAAVGEELPHCLEVLYAGAVRGVSMEQERGRAPRKCLAVTQPCSLIPGEDVMLGCHHLLQHPQFPGNCFTVQVSPHPCCG